VITRWHSARQLADASAGLPESRCLPACEDPRRGACMLLRATAIGKHDDAILTPSEAGGGRRCPRLFCNCETFRAPSIGIAGTSRWRSHASATCGMLRPIYSATDFNTVVTRWAWSRSGRTSCISGLDLRPASACHRRDICESGRLKPRLPAAICSAHARNRVMHRTLRGSITLDCPSQGTSVPGGILRVIRSSRDSRI
jgi:hypothetical protein